MNDYDTRTARRYWPHVVVATAAVAVLPVAVVWWLRSRGAIASPWVGLGFAMALSLVASCVGRAYWKRRRGPRDLLFGELLVWGWLRRVRMERQLTRSMGLLRADEQPGGEAESASRRFRILSQLAAALEAQDAYTDGHSRRVAAHAVLVARRMGLSGDEVARVRAAAAVHDIGKIRVPRELLDKPGELTSAEFELVKAHADVGAEIVDGLGDPELTAIVRHHHERFDGTGYPSGLAHERIPLGARIVAVADTFDALTSVRPYRPAAPHKRALEFLAGASGSQLDPVAVRAFLRCYSGNKAIVFWTLLTVPPQRVVAWLGDKHPAPRTASLGSLTTTASVAAAIGVTAIGTPFGPGPGTYVVHEVRDRASPPMAAPPGPAGTSVPRRTSPHTRYRPSAARPTHRGHAAQPSRRVSAASRGTADRAAVGAGSVRPGALVGGSGGKPGGGPRGQPGRGLGHGPNGGSNGGSGGRPAGGSTGAPGRVPAGTPAGGANGAAPGGGPASGPASGSGSGSAGGSGNGSAGGSGNGSAGGSSGTSGGGGSGGTGTATPTTKDQCKTGGYVQYAFPNQGQCVAFVERGPR